MTDTHSKSDDEYDDEGFLAALADMPLTPAVAGKVGPLTNVPKIPTSTPAKDEDEVLPMTQWNLADIYPDDDVQRHNRPRPDEPDDDGSSSKKRKMARFESLQGDTDGDERERPSTHDEAPAASKTTGTSNANYLESSAYEPIRFGEFSRYMKNKRAKLKVQEASLRDEEEALLAAAAAASNATQHPQSTDSAAAPTASPSSIFKGCTMYITGHTNPPYAELRRLIVLHGGDFMAYLDQKSPVTHIIASNLTPKKRLEFQAYRVVRPEWITDSIKAARRLPWNDFKVESDAGGAMGVDTLPSGRIVPKTQQNDFLVDAFTSKAAAKAGATAAAQSSFAQKFTGANPHLADANPWGRATAQRKLTGFQAQRPQAHVPVQRPTSRSISPEKKPKTPPPPSPPSSQLTAAEEEWLSSLETPPKPKQKTSGEQSATGTSHPTTPNQQASEEDSRPLNETPTTPKQKDYASAIGTDPVSRVAAQVAGHHQASHPYAQRPSNTHAAKLLASPSWREKNTATSESFLSGFFAKSRLHYLSTWKGELKDLVSQALKDAGREEGSQPLPKGTSRVIMHVDFDSFFVSVGLRDRPDLVDQPVVVCHAGSRDGGGAGVSSTSEIASCNYVARKFGVHNGWSLGRARQVCPKVQTIPYDFEAYKNISIDFYSLMLLHADAIEAVSVDEALIDVSKLLQEMRVGGSDDDSERNSLLSAYRDYTSSQGEQWTEEKQLAEALRDEIRRRTRCEASIGIGSNTLLARLATRHAKPGGSYHLKDCDIGGFVDKLEVDDLQGVGYNTRHRFQSVFGTSNVGELKRIASQSKFVSELGPKLGKQVWDKMHGIDRAELEGAKQRQSVGAAVNYGIRFQNQDEAEVFVRNLSQEVSNRLVNYGLRGKQLNVTVMIRDPEAPVEAPKFLGHGICDVHNRSSAMGGPGGVHTNDAQIIFKAAWKLIKGLNALPNDLRGIAISCTKLDPVHGNRQPTTRVKGGQSLLNFQRTPEKDRGGASAAAATPTSTTTTPSSKLRLPPVNANQEESDDDDDDDDEDQSDAEELQAGPLASLPRLPGTQSVHRTSRSPSPTAARSIHRTAAFQAQQRARSAEPTPSQSKKKEAGPSDGRGRNDDADWSLGLPTMSQLDQSVLKELPPSIRAEVLRESKRLSKRGSGSTMTTSGGGMAAMTRSLSASPSANRAQRGASLLTSFLGGSKTKSKTMSKNKGPKTTSATATATTSSSAAPDRARIQSMDPKRITAAELQSLEIDPEVFAALPLSMQRETLLHQSATIKGREARFISGYKKVEKTLAEERRFATDRAALSACGIVSGGGAAGGGGGGSAATPESDALFRALKQDPTTLPTIQKRSSTAEVQSLLTRWISSHARQKPRTNDVSKFATFLVECVAGGEGGGTSISRDFEKAQDLLVWWKLELERVLGIADGHADADSDADEARCKARIGWWDAFERVQSQVDATVQSHFGAGAGGRRRRFKLKL